MSEKAVKPNQPANFIQYLFCSLLSNQYEKRNVADFHIDLRVNYGSPA